MSFTSPGPSAQTSDLNVSGFRSPVLNAAVDHLLSWSPVVTVDGVRETNQYIIPLRPLLDGLSQDARAVFSARRIHLLDSKQFRDYLSECIDRYLLDEVQNTPESSSPKALSAVELSLPLHATLADPTIDAPDL